MDPATDEQPAPRSIMEATRHASHRRDHDHQRDRGSCSPHTVEVIDLGAKSFAVCHCCGYESPTSTHHEAMAAAAKHRLPSD